MSSRHSSALAIDRILTIVVAGLTLLVVAPAWSGAVVQAQASCASDDPPCPTPPPLSLGVQAISERVRLNPVTVYFTATGLGTGTKSASATVDGVTVGAPAWQYESNGASANGSVQVTLAAGTHTVAITFCESGRAPECASDSTPVIYEEPPPAPAQGQPIATQEPASSYRRSLAGCAGCAYTTLSYSTPSYRSLDQDRSVTLLYSSATSAPRGTVVLDVNVNSSSVPDRISVQLVNAQGVAVTLSHGQTEMFYHGGPGMSRITAQFDAAMYGTGFFYMTAVVRNWWGTSFLETQLPLTVPILDQRYGSIASGWTFAGVQLLRLSAGGNGPAMIAEDNQVILFPNCGWLCWTAPPGEGSTLSHNASTGRYERRYTDGTVVEFDPATGHQMLVRDRLGLQSTFEYDNSGRLSSITDPAGFVTTILRTLESNGWTTATVTTPGGRTTRVRTDAENQLNDIIDPDGVIALATGYADHRITVMVDRLGGRTDYAYDAYGGLATVTGPAVQRDDGQVASSTITYRSREAALLPASGTGTSANPAARVLPHAAWVRVTSPRGDNLKLLANGAGDATTTVTTDALGKTDSTVIVYDSADQPREVWSSSGTRMEYRWDRDMLRQAVDNVANVATDYSYNSFAQLTEMRVNQALQRTNFYSADSRSALDSSRAGTSVSRYTSDALGRVLTATDGGGHQSSFAYQAGALQNLASVTKNGKTTQFEYDALGRRTGVTDALGQTSSVGYDLLNRPTSATALGHGTSSWSYDDASRTYTFTDGKLQQYTAVANALGATVAETSPAAPSLSDRYAYDLDGNLSSVTTRAQRTRQITRDLLGRPTQIAAGGLVTTIAYDTARKWTAYSNAESTDTIFVDGDGRVTKQTTFRPGGHRRIPARCGSRCSRPTGRRGSGGA